MNLSAYPDEHLIHMPFISETRPPPSQVVCESLTELQAPLMNRFIGYNNTALCHQYLNIPITERESEIKPYAMTYDFRWETMAAVEIRASFH
jgi:hypothetical protein